MNVPSEVGNDKQGAVVTASLRVLNARVWHSSHGNGPLVVVRVYRQEAMLAKSRIWLR